VINRRSFLDAMITAGTACAFLPGAGRLWKPSREIVWRQCGMLLYDSEGNPYKVHIDNAGHIHYTPLTARYRNRGAYLINPCGEER